jgi:hypothetical protein
VKRALWMLVVVLMTGTARADDPPQIAGIYTDMYFNRTRESLLGVEIFVIPSREGYHVLFQGAGGNPDVPVLVPANVDGDRLEFVLPERTGYTGRFVGVFRDDALVGRFEPAQINRVTDTWEFRLRRTNSYWQ